MKDNVNVREIRADERGEDGMWRVHGRSSRRGRGLAQRIWAITVQNGVSASCLSRLCLYTQQEKRAGRRREGSSTQHGGNKRSDAHDQSRQPSAARPASGPVFPPPLVLPRKPQRTEKNARGRPLARHPSTPLCLHPSSDPVPVPASPSSTCTPDERR